MVFSSIPAYLDAPSWNQPSHRPVAGGLGGGVDAHLVQPAAAPRPDGNVGGPARPGSMAERARLANMPQPDPGLKCPRCESTNTKFCYFNNYSLSQPRHFCKTCRRYWTRGGALRNVPVGGGFRRNKRSKSCGGGAKSSAAAANRLATGISASRATSAAAATSASLSSNIPPPPQLPPLMSSWHPLTADYGGAAANIRLNLGSMQPIETLDFHVGSCSSIGLEHWKLPQVQQFPFLGGLEPTAAAALPTVGFFPFNEDHWSVDGVLGGLGGQLHGKPSTSELITQLASVKMEENPQELVLPKQYLGFPRGDRYWVGGGSGGSTGGGGSFEEEAT